MHPNDFKERLEDETIVAAIREAEARTSGEIRVFVTRHSPRDPMAEARRQFFKLRMHQTPERNGVLLYFAPRSRRFAIVGDDGIHQRCGQEFWDRTAVAMSGLLKANEWTGAIVAGIREAGVELARHFPKPSGDLNDLPDSVVRD